MLLSLHYLTDNIQLAAFLRNIFEKVTKHGETSFHWLRDLVYNRQYESMALTPLTSARRCLTRAATLRTSQLYPNNHPVR